MTEVDIAGAGIWSQKFGNWDEFQDALAGREVESGGVLKPELIPARERRRAPAAVKMAVEVMDQACCMADIKSARPRCMEQDPETSRPPGLSSRLAWSRLSRVYT